MYVKAEAGAENVLAEQPLLLSLCYGKTETVYCDGVLRTDVEIAVLRTPVKPPSMEMPLEASAKAPE